MKNIKQKALLCVCVVSLLSACEQSKQLETQTAKDKEPSIWPYITSEAVVSKDVESRVKTTCRNDN
ncbi:hypothetical protein JL49_22780 [Pseudoalteromonas luteoviolacea]|uniref:Uncharacterized protein n=1 Tax=Pseudoalteromonas luteoviolacea NCIMB 1942 TaxID=1365253 RepID=A0A167BY92_9GAMM|nr:hypothetical protein N482_02110 [Pseudoalteromonas luteoviolacea NCIMB 1942]KZW98517.1 hypothetical protein JL49_22780 [Pseudoalteromonas luteoviolacea]